MRESDIEAYLMKCVKHAGGETRKVNWIGRKDAPDRLVMLKGRGFFAELKAPGKEPMLPQRLEHDRLRRAGFVVHVIDSFLAAERALETCR